VLGAAYAVAARGVKRVGETAAAVTPSAAIGAGTASLLASAAASCAQAGALCMP
jgi:hypothetical protein